MDWLQIELEVFKIVLPIVVAVIAWVIRVERQLASLRAKQRSDN